MNSIEFNAQFGDKTRHVELSSNDSGGGGYQILIDKYYHGVIRKVNGEWRAHLNDKSFLTGDDITALIETIENSK